MPGRHLRCSLVAGLCLAAAGPARAATPVEVDHAIDRAVEYLYSKQKPDGSWEFTPKRDSKQAGYSETGGQWGGTTALATYALVAAGQDVHSPRLAKAIDWLKHADLIGVYALGVRCQVWLLMPQTPETRNLIRMDAGRLEDGFNANPHTRSGFLYGYLTTKKDLNTADHSSSQFGVLGMWAAEQVRPESVSSTYWGDVEKRWVHDQQSDGGWYYHDEPFDPGDHIHAVTQASMTAAGVATLFITQDYTHPERFGKCDGNVTNPAIDKGLAYMASHLDAWVPNVVFGTPEAEQYGCYTLYGVERIGVASGLKYIGTTNWYEYGADWIVHHQDADGSVPNAHDLDNTAFAVLFMARGRAPILINKVQYDDADGPNAGKPGHWNERPRDVANLVRYAGRQTERDLNWQVTNLKVPEAELHDAPFLYLAGNQAMRLAAEDKQKLKQFCDQGGTILFNADCGGGPGGAAANPFTASALALAHDLYPDYEFRDLPANHVIYSEQFTPRNWKRPPTVRGLSNGVRELMILFPDDPAKAWQLRQTLGAGKEEQFQAMQDVILYATDKRPLRLRGIPFLVAPDPQVKAARTVKVGRLKYAGNWDPEPGGWRRLSAVLHNAAAHVDVDGQPVTFGQNQLAGLPLVTMTGTTPFKLTADQQKELSDYVAHGGTLVVDAAGGSAGFVSSAEALLGQMYPHGLGGPLPPTDPIYTAFNPKLEVRYRSYAKQMLGRLSTPQVKAIVVDGRPAVYVSREDLSGGLVGEDIDGIIGYDPDTATAIMAGLVLTAAK